MKLVPTRSGESSASKCCGVGRFSATFCSETKKRSVLKPFAATKSSSSVSGRSHTEPLDVELLAVGVEFAVPAVEVDHHPGRRRVARDKSADRREQSYCAAGVHGEQLVVRGLPAARPQTYHHSATSAIENDAPRAGHVGAGAVVGAGLRAALVRASRPSGRALPAAGSGIGGARR
eukprot:scaffold74821_cov59-Phaeocystis_antarctica.AAC.2